MSLHRIIYTLERSDADGDMEEREIEVFYTAEGGAAPSGLNGPFENYDPGAAPEFMIDGEPRLIGGEPANLTDDEMLKVLAYIEDRHEME